MTTSRRTTLKLGAAAIVLGPSVIISRTAQAGPKVALEGYKASQFKVKVAGVYDEVPNVLSVDLGSVSLDGIKGLKYSGIKFVVAAGTDTSKMTIKWAPEYTKQKKVSVEGLKISVSLLKPDGQTPGVTFDAANAVPISVETTESGDQMLWYKITSLKRTDHKVEAPGVKLPRKSFKVEIEGLGTTAGFSMSKAVYDWVGGSMSKAVFDGVKVATSELKLDEAALKVESGKLKVESGKLKVETQVSLKHYVTSSITMVEDTKLATTPLYLKIESSNLAKGEAKGLNFSKAVVTSIEFPKLAVGSNALVTETLNFAPAVDGI